MPAQKISTQKGSKKGSAKRPGSLQAVLAYTPPRLSKGKEWYVEFYAFDPEKNSLRRKKIKITRIKPIRERQKYAAELIKRLSEKLAEGWNPWIERDLGELVLVSETLQEYDAYLSKMYSSGYYRKETYIGYKSYLKNFEAYTIGEHQVTYLYQIDQRYLSRFLDHIFIERDNSAQTHNNYLGFLRVFFGHLLTKGAIKNNPASGLKNISKRLIKKKRQVIPAETLSRIGEWLYDHDRYFLLACHILYYCLVRPVEMTRLRIGDFNIKNQTLRMDGAITKNKESQIITVPKKVFRLMIDLEIFKHPGSNYLFSDGLRPGESQIDTINFRHHWDMLRKALRLPTVYQFYSLKDTGITDMLRAHIGNLSVRDQARHSSLAITNIYTPERSEADADLTDYEGSL